MDRDTLDRRTVLKTMAAGAAAATIAGCSSGGGSGDDGSGGSDTTADGGDSGGSSDSVSFDGWFDGVSNFDGVVDETGKSEVTVKVGSKGNNGNYAFGPAAVKVSTGTKVVWEWTGKGSLHNVVADNGDFESEQKMKEGFTFSHTFDSAGTYKYYCTPHKTMGMKGAIVVE
ncbi:MULTISPECIES: halocyanin domain-containing protein [Halorussus]|uniref:halocyanin domain-containing protein n=1 Tax=Halorussus TaxID=1070314 RepID=UPI000E21880D|nr:MULTISPECIES: halocyanin domain-containing protein [Halorussus]NHN60264.1 halocyanin domain-containing protein [Halorussus sp. JP-T4]